MRQKLQQRVFRLLIWNSSFGKSIFLLYHTYLTRAAIAVMKLRAEQKNTINSFGSNGTLISKGGSNIFNEGALVELVSYVQTARNVIVNLEENFTALFGSPPLKIMPLGDSITSGVVGGNDRGSGGYRTELWNKLMAEELPVKFVGSMSSGPADLIDKDHEGHPGWTIGEIAGSVEDWLNTAQPDLILLMIGTNDTKNRSLKTMVNELSTLIDQITAQLPNVQLLVASIPPIHPALRPLERVLRAMYFNEAIPYIVNSRVAQGKKVHFVDMRSLTLNDLTSSVSLDLDNGLHPNTQGYRKIANVWHAAVLKVIHSRLRIADSR